ncbi:FG-GAP-like repeat-containing protein [Verrucomicrobiaceae bacterium 227]
MNSIRSLKNLSTPLVVSLLLIACREDNKQEAPDDSGADQPQSSLDSSATQEPTSGGMPAVLDPGPAGLSAEPLEAVTSGGAGTVFESLSPDQTGLDFVNPIDQSHPQKHLYASAVACGGVAIGDVDGDGWPDIFLTSGPKKNRLFRQTSPMKFEDVTKASRLDSGDAWSAGAAMVDIDNDGDLDIYICNFDTPNHLFINKGDGTFEEKAKQYGVDYVGAGHTPTFCDYDRDGDLDFYLMTNFYYDPRGKTNQPISGLVNGKPSILPGFEKYYEITKIRRGEQPGSISIDHGAVGQPDRLVRNNGDGTFTEVSAQAGISGNGKGNSATWWDYNEDGWPDIYVGNDFQDPDRLYRNNGDGTFTNTTEEMVPHTTWYSMGADFGDLDGDGAMDFAMADMSGTNHFKQKTAMGAMSDSAEFLNTAVPRQYMRNVVYLNSRGGRFMEAAYLAGLANSDWTWTVRLADFDNDGRVDVFFSNGMSRNLNVSDNPEMKFINPGETEWDKHMRAKTPELREQNLAYRNLGEMKFENVSKDWGLDHVGMSFASATADFDRDGDLDLVVCNLDEPVSVYQNNTADGNRVIVRLKGRHNSWGIGAKVTLKTESGTQVRQLTPIRGYMASHEPVLHFGLGDQEQIDQLTVEWPGGHVQSFENIEANQRLTIVEPEGKVTPTKAPAASETIFQRSEALTDIRQSEIPYNDFARQPLLPNRYSNLGPGMAWGDIDGDGDDDLWLGGARARSGQIHRNDGKGKFTQLEFPAGEIDQHSEDMGGLWLDVDSDGDLDLYVVSGGVECDPDTAVLRDRIYLNDGKGGFAKAADEFLPDNLESGSAVVAADYDRDGDLDLFVGGRIIPGKYPLTPKSRLLQNDGGRLVNAPQATSALEEIGLVTAAVWSDVDNDGWIDLLVAQEWGPIKYFRNNEGTLSDQTAGAGLAEVLGWWNGITAIDVDNDGDMDYAVTNFGLNTKYHASVKKPTLLYYGDFEKKGEPNIIEAEFEDETLFPVRGLSCSSGAMPHLKGKFKTFTSFALADLNQIYEPKTLNNSKRCEANTLESGVFMNEGGKFTFKPFPRLAQIAPGFGIVAGDFDGDSHADLYLVQNFYSPQAETGRMAGGVSVLLKGHGDGTFAAVAPRESGLYVGGDAKSLTTVDLNGDGRLDLVAGVNDDFLVAFEQSSSPQKQLMIQLRSKNGNTLAAGSRITVKFDDGSSRSIETTAGGGYLSQSAPLLNIGMPDGVKVVDLEVRWPDGTSWKSDVNDISKTIVIVQE